MIRLIFETTEDLVVGVIGADGLRFPAVFFFGTV